MPRLCDKIRLGVSKREDFPLLPQVSALLIIDIQKYLSGMSNDGNTMLCSSYFTNDSLPQAIDNIGNLVQAFRVVRDGSAADKSACEVIWTYLQTKTRDGRDMSMDYKLSGAALANIPRVDVTFDQLFLDELRPDMSSGKGDILLPKTSCSVFQSTNLDYLLRNLGIEQLVIVGQLTDQCIESAVRDAADLGYFVTVVENACAAQSLEAHQKGIGSMKGFARIVNASQVVEELRQSPTQVDSAGE
jgi:ureidoacrylate peracid hydrolase